MTTETVSQAPSGIEGNTKGSQEKATEVRELNKNNSWVLAFRFGIPLFSIAVLVVVAKAESGFFWNIAISIALIVIGSLLSSIKEHEDMRKWWKAIWLLPLLAKTAGWTALVIVLLSSGIGQWTESKFSKLEASAACAADDVCSALKEKEQELERRKILLARSNAVRPIIVPEVTTAQCGFEVEFSSFSNCEAVTFRNGGSKLLVDVPKGMCPLPHNFSLARIEHLHDDVYRATAKLRDEVTVYFFNIPIGEKYRNFTCGA